MSSDGQGLELPMDEHGVEVLLREAATLYQQAVLDFRAATGPPGRRKGELNAAQLMERAAVGANLSMAAARLGHALTGRIHVELARLAEARGDARYRELVEGIEGAGGLVEDVTPGPGVWAVVEPSRSALGRVAFHRPGTYQIEVGPGGVDVTELLDGREPYQPPTMTGPHPTHPFVDQQQSPTHCLLVVGRGETGPFLCNKPPDHPIHNQAPGNPGRLVDVVDDAGAWAGPEARPDA